MTSGKSMCELDSVLPAIVRDAVVGSVRRWQTRRIALLFSHQGFEEGLRLKPVVNLLRSDFEDWGPLERKQLGSAIVGGQ